MKQILIAAAITAASTIALTTPALAADVGVSISVGQPGFYGQLDIGNYPRPQLIYAQPIIIDRIQYEREPVYLRVPPGHAKHWSKHCREYNACGERVYFVQDNWYEQQYVPRYRERHHDHQDEHYGDHDGNDHSDNHGQGNGHGNGNGNGHGKDH